MQALLFLPPPKLFTKLVFASFSHGGKVAREASDLFFQSVKVSINSIFYVIGSDSKIHHFYQQAVLIEMVYLPAE